METRDLRIDADIRFAVTPPAHLYLDESWYRLVAERVLVQSWHAVAEKAAVAVKETVHPLTLLPGALDEPLVLTRDRKERLHCLANSCTDRGELVCTACGPAKLLRCAAHGRTWRLDGEMMEAPGFEGVPGFPSPSDSLARLPVAVWGPLVFASLAPVRPFDDVIRPLMDAPGTPPLHDAVSASREEFDANWALCVEDLLAAMGPADLELLPAAVVRRAPRFQAWLFPSTVVEVAPFRLTVRTVEPMDVARTRVRLFAWLARDQAEGDDVARLDASRLADAQRGLRSRARRPGHYAPSRDRAVHHFHRLLAQSLSRP
jgi:choline monooxygenase